MGSGGVRGGGWPNGKISLVVCLVLGAYPGQLSCLAAACTHRKIHNTWKATNLPASLPSPLPCLLPLAWQPSCARYAIVRNADELLRCVWQAAERGVVGKWQQGVNCWQSRNVLASGD